MEWGTTVESKDFSGRFKILWSSSQSLLYFLVEITDDVFVDGYHYPDKDYFHYDILEIFIDEDKSGGLHVFDNNQKWGKNAENAFSYHIIPEVSQLKDGDPIRSFYAFDIAGSNWNDIIFPNYKDHVPEFTLIKNGNQYVWEFSLALYDETYDHSNPEISRVKLEAGKLIGLTVAYCDNDENDGERDSFFANVSGDASKLSIENGKKIYNEAWKSADNYGSLILKGMGTFPK